MTDKDKIQALFSDETILKEFLGQKDIESAKKFLENHGVEVSEEDLKVVGEVIDKCANKIRDMSDENLEKIIGGKVNIDRTSEAWKVVGKIFAKGALAILECGAGLQLTGSTPDELGIKEPYVSNGTLTGAGIALLVLSGKNFASVLAHINSSFWWGPP